MKIALLGYGRMGKAIERIAKSRGHEVVTIIDKDNPKEVLNGAEVAINFSIPSAAVANITHALNEGVAVVCGTTGWLDSRSDVESLCAAKKGAFLYASNFSLGVNIFFALNEKLAQVMGQYKQYHASLTEIHHTQKLDAPSGTAITIAEGILPHIDKNNWALEGEAKKMDLPIRSVRLPEVPGTHTVDYNSETEKISIEHIAHNRDGFAMGAVIAAEWVNGKSGIFTMKDVLNIN
ncbi:MAG: 4-hydroxy-tetrahydrodipicolinate reductase [Flavobacteriaceae bacterium]|nr:4-hydroxy-tetrahydrodipicolinate reductase [Flavobacteriaceae bacterium]|tara:strand:+ start:1927 stop:2631 length:705 start_codon:yes stop_codon:yes gene_type:complete